MANRPCKPRCPSRSGVHADHLAVHVNQRSAITGLTAASVWMNRDDCVPGSERRKLLTTPAVTEPVKPKGEPIAAITDP